MKTVSFLVTLLALVQSAFAIPPACLLAALGQQSDPSNVDSLCKGFQDAMLGNLTQVCTGDALQSAYDTYSSKCSGLGIKVADLPEGSSSGGGSSRGGSGSGSGSGSEDDKKDAAAGISPPLFVVVTGLLATLMSVALL